MIIIGIGSNQNGHIGGRVDNIYFALQNLNCNRVRLCNISSIYETTPLLFKNQILNKDQAKYLNMVAIIETYMPPSALMKYLHNIERSVAARSSKRWSARALDLDILCYKSLIISNPTKRASKYKSRYKPLSLPHPQLYNRAFNLHAIDEIAPSWHHPILNVKPAALLRSPKTNNIIGGDIIQHKQIPTIIHNELMLKTKSSKKQRKYR